MVYAIEFPVHWGEKVKLSNCFMYYINQTSQPEHWRKQCGAGLVSAIGTLMVYDHTPPPPALIHRGALRLKRELWRLFQVYLDTKCLSIWKPCIIVQSPWTLELDYFEIKKKSYGTTLWAWTSFSTFLSLSFLICNTYIWGCCEALNEKVL